MVSGSLARRYARALFEIGAEQGNFERLGREVAQLAEAIEGSQELEATLSNPVFPRDDRENVLRAVLQRLGASQIVVNFTRLLLDRERVVALPDIARELEAMIAEKSGRVKAKVVSASPLSPTQEQKLIRALEELSGRKIEADVSQDPGLLGGVVAQVGDTVYDGSLRTHLEQLKHGLAKQSA